MYVLGKREVSYPKKYNPKKMDEINEQSEKSQSTLHTQPDNTTHSQMCAEAISDFIFLMSNYSMPNRSAKFRTIFMANHYDNNHQDLKD